MDGLLGHLTIDRQSGLFLKRANCRACRWPHYHINGAGIIPKIIQLLLNLLQLFFFADSRKRNLFGCLMVEHNFKDLFRIGQQFIFEQEPLCFGHT